MFLQLSLELRALYYVLSALSRTILQKKLEFSVIKFPINASSPSGVWRIHPLSYRFLEDPSSLFRGIRLNSGQPLRRGSITLQIRDLQLNDARASTRTHAKPGVFAV